MNDVASAVGRDIVARAPDREEVAFDRHRASEPHAEARDGRRDRRDLAPAGFACGIVGCTEPAEDMHTPCVERADRVVTRRSDRKPRRFGAVERDRRAERRACFGRAGDEPRGEPPRRIGADGALEQLDGAGHVAGHIAGHVAGHVAGRVATLPITGIGTVCADRHEVRALRLGAAALDGQRCPEVVAGPVRVRVERALGSYLERTVRSRRRAHDHHAPRLECIVAVGRRRDRDDVAVGCDRFTEPADVGALGSDDVDRAKPWRRRGRLLRAGRELPRDEDEHAAHGCQHARAAPCVVASTNGSPSPAATLRCGRTFASRLSGHRSFPPFRRLIRPRDATTRGEEVAKVRSFSGDNFDAGAPPRPTAAGEGPFARLAA